MPVSRLWRRKEKKRSCTEQSLLETVSMWVSLFWPGTSGHCCLSSAILFCSLLRARPSSFKASASMAPKRPLSCFLFARYPYKNPPFLVRHHVGDCSCTLNAPTPRRDAYHQYKRARDSRTPYKLSASPMRVGISSKKQQHAITPHAICANPKVYSQMVRLSSPVPSRTVRRPA